MKLDHFSLSIDQDGIALLTWDMRNKPVNVFTLDLLDELDRLIDYIAQNERINGTILFSGKKSFSAGADLKTLEDLLKCYRARRETDTQGAALAFLEETGRLSQVFRKLETCPKPFIAAINGSCMGSGLELALACHSRIAADTLSTTFCLPEVQLGIMPCGGGIQRILRLVTDLDAAMGFALTGKQLTGKDAKSLGLIDETAPAKRLIEAAKRRLGAGIDPVKPWDKTDFKFPSGDFYSPEGMQFWASLIARYRALSYDNYPNIRALLNAATEGLHLSFDQALKVEQRFATRLLVSSEASNMVRTLFFSRHQLDSGVRRPASQRPNHIKKVGILGAGYMGAGIAYVTAQAGIRVHMLDLTQELADKGFEHCTALAQKAQEQGISNEKVNSKLLSFIQVGTDYSVLNDCDLVIEAVVEDRTAKKQVTEKAAQFMKPRATFASDTSTLPITSLAQYFPRPRSFIGLHFFTPPEKMQLVEVVKTKQTSAKTLSVAMDFIKALSKTPIVVEDGRGFYTSRIVMTYAAEGAHMLRDGVPPAMIENAGLMAGMPIGPMGLADDVALDHAYNIVKAARQDMGKRFKSPIPEELLEELVVKRQRFGRKNQRGFYDYEGENRFLWQGITEITGASKPAAEFEIEELKDRLLVIQALEAARIFEEKRITDVREADIGSIFGFGFPPYTGGALSYIDDMGADVFVVKCKGLQKRWGERFRPTKLLRDLARHNEGFYGRFPPQPQGNHNHKPAATWDNQVATL
ncbi:3-hydroxyacyl-CoA dehydrogenase NAD-binding domain-containing protein [Flexibacterium corallicola]|uniref:3-hydroxyacyl-CoA dehydrogenase NAD-binding domain-containing protein n=1 Tax=Flexibacterium corallicola TaxID=3037259 RepID=UPI00286F734D|nr:3-hydroxyacyl-CoA dehydrogenase NAD-binding domain-containing protein [Pseudovibrio sp. M1P-2-3]